MGSGSSDLEQENVRTLPASTSHFLQDWASLLLSTHELQLGSVQMSLHGLYQIGRSATDHSVSLVKATTVSLAHILIQQLSVLTSVLGNNAEASEAPLLDTNLNLAKLRFTSVDDASIETQEGSSTLVAIRDLDIPEAAKSLLLEAQANLLEQDHSASGTSSTKSLGVAYIKFSFACLLLYVPNVPKDPGTESILHSKFCDWVLHRAEKKAQAQKIVHESFTGGTESPRTDLVDRHVQDAYLKSLQAPGISLLRPERSQLHQLQAEFDFCLALAEEDGPAQQLLHSYLSGSPMADSQFENVAHSLNKLEARLQKWSGYQDVIGPVLVALSGLRTGFRLLSENQQFHQRDLSLTTTNTIMPDPLQVLNNGDILSNTPKDKSSILAAVLQLRLRLSIFGYQQKDYVLLRKYSRQMFEEWFVRREQEMREAEQSTSVFKYTADTEPSIDDYTELFPDYEGVNEQIRKSDDTRAVDTRIFAELSAMLKMATQPGVQQSVSLLDTMKNLLDLSDPRSDHKEVPQAEACILATATYAASRNLKALENDQIHKTDPDYDFYRSSNISQTKKIISMLSQLITRIREIISVWPENSVLLDIEENVQRLLNASMALPVAQSLTMLENIFGLLAQWQEVASREFAVDSLFAIVRDQIIEWRRFELSCWPRLFGLEERAVLREDAKMWYNLYEVLIFSPEQHQGDLGDDFLRNTVQLLMQFMRSSNVGQFSGRLELLETFSRFVSLTAGEEDRHQFLDEAVRHVLYHFTAYLPQVNAFLTQERSVLAKEVNQVIKLASWKDTNVFALRESSRRSHRTLYKLVHKYRRVLLVPVQQLLAKGLRELTTEPVRKQAIPVQLDLARPESLNHGVVWSQDQWPARYQEPSRTAKKINTVQQLVQANSANHLQLFVDDAIASMKQLRSETPTVFEKSKIPLIKHLKNRKRKLLSDSFKALKELGLKSVLRADDLESQRDAETLFLSVPAQQWNMQPDSIEQYFYRLVDILPNVRTGYANHAEDVTAGEVKRGIGYFDSIMSHLLKERSTLYTFCSHIKRFELGQAQFFSVCVGQQRGLRELDVRGNYGAFSAWRTQAAQSVATLKQMLELTTAYHEAYRGFTSKPCTSLANLPWWEQLVYDLDCMESGVLSDQQIVCPLSSWESEAEHLNVILRTAHAHCCAYQNDNQDAAYILENLAVWLAHKLQSQDTINSKEIPELTATVLSNKLFKLCDTMLLATQNINLSSRRETPDSDQSLWYVRASIRHRSRLRSANLATIANDLLEITHCMQEGSLQISSHELQRLCTQVAPVVQAYYQMCVALDQEYRAFHNNTSRCALLIGQTLQTLASSGFCSPEPADQNPGESKATEDGTGLGSGQGADDITKDLEDDEDLGDLEGAEDIDGQNEKDDKDEAKEIEDDVGGALEDVDEQENSDDDASGSDDGSDMDEEIGEVDEENDTALDEKMWDSEKDDLREKETEKKDQEQQQEDEQNQDIDLVNREDQTEENEQAEKPEQPEEKPEKVDDTEQELNNDKDNDNDEEIRDDGDDRIDEAHNLELPEDMNIDDEVDLDEDENEDGEEQSEEVDSNDVDDVSDDVSEQNPADDKGDDMNESMEDADSEKDGEEVDAKADEEKGAVEEEEEATEVPTVEDNTNQKEETEEQIDDMTVDEGGSEAGGDDKDTNDIGKNSTENKEQRTEQDAENLEIETTEVEKDNQDSTENDAQGTDGKTGEQSASSDDQGSEEIRSLGNALEQFRRLLHIHDAPSQENKTAKDQEQEDSQNHDGADQFEHIADDETPDTQAMGPNKQEDATVPGQNSEDIVPELEDNRPEPIEDESMGLDEDENPPLVNDENGKSIQDENPLENSLQEFSRQDKSHSDHEDENMEDDQDKVEPVMAIQQATSASAQLWQKYQQSTRDLANGLSEQLRLILEPTLATKMKGDFRTGKRLNMRRIIPYIASQFKKDKIWMRRSKPSKRQYQVMLAIDDSKSMSESSSVQLAFETVALVSTALSVLEVGQMSVVKFGSQPEIVHSFQDQFSSESGSKIFESFTFDQTKTNVKALAAQSLDMFRDARATQHSSGAELWQLQFIISDGICEDHESIRRIMRQAQEERIMVVFLVIDTIHGAKKHSILQMSQVKYLTQPDGSKKLHIIQYMEEFAFENFLIIQNVSELPELLCSTIRQFFAASQ
ncbi:protein of unknown function [Taphrina deformans PYCC 5710]|uniref:VWFA domain-containing protein n=1 Tax=Taphrina deformans (strain PYCC 5710 / ATCC 11124 / CBS 356.35 / IMI 108563 / JCM 9778 / NBRC 8474) TaxID=1097556 RepID=R4XK34_TAPDE|nr:protein of unknown function [Taphrina deformans PYCC 5710]|eukprot:CCG84813.1 protein of unknown function [Taphrina deformans PYCC 5710]